MERLSLSIIIIKFPYNARSDWPKQRALSENRARVDDGKLASSNFCFGILTNLTQINKLNMPCGLDKCSGNELFVCSKYSCRETIVINNRSAKTVLK